MQEESNKPPKDDVGGMLEELRQDYEHNGSLTALRDAVHFIYLFGLRTPEWVYNAVVQILLEKSAERPGRGNRSALEKERQEMVDWLRWREVCRLREQNVPWNEVYEAASQNLNNPALAGSDSAIKASYQRHQQRRNELG